MPSARRLLFAVTALPATAASVSVVHEHSDRRNKFGDGDGSHDVVTHIASIQTQLAALQKSMLKLKAKGTDIELADRYRYHPKPRQPKAKQEDESVVQIDKTYNTAHATISKDDKLVLPRQPRTKLPRTESMLPARTVVSIDDDTAKRATLRQPALRAEDVEAMEGPSLQTPISNSIRDQQQTASDDARRPNPIVSSSVNMVRPCFELCRCARTIRCFVRAARDGRFEHCLVFVAGNKVSGDSIICVFGRTCISCHSTRTQTGVLRVTALTTTPAGHTVSQS